MDDERILLIMIFLFFFQCLIFYVEQLAVSQDIVQLSNIRLIDWKKEYIKNYVFLALYFKNNEHIHAVVQLLMVKIYL